MSVSALPGDADGSGRVDGVDLALVARALGTVRGQPGFSASHDADGDGRIGERDLAIVRANFGRAGKNAAVWVADSGRDRLVQLDAVTGAAVRTVGSIDRPEQTAVDTLRGVVWTIAGRGTEVVRVSPAGVRQATLSGFVDAVDLAVLARDGSCWVVERSGGRLYALDANAPDGYDVALGQGSHRVVTDVGSSLIPGCLSIDGRRAVVWLATPFPATGIGRLTRLLASAPSGYSLTTGTGSHRQSGVFQSPSRFSLAAVQPADGSCYVIDPEGERVLVRVDPGNTRRDFRLPGIGEPTAMAANELEGSVWLATRSSTEAEATTDLVRIAPDGREALRVTGVWPADVAIDPTDGGVWIVNRAAGSVERYSSSGRRTLSIPGFSGAASLALVPAEPIAQAPVARGSVAPALAAIGQGVTFSATAAPGAAPIARTEWDFDGDGTFEFSALGTPATTRAYQGEGVYNPVLRVVDTAGLTGIDYTPLVRVGGLSVRLSATTDSTPLLKNLVATVRNPTGTPLAHFQWDLNDDGVFDAFRPATGDVASLEHRFQAPGIYPIRVQVTDAAGRTATAAERVTVQASELEFRVSLNYGGQVASQDRLAVRFQATVNQLTGRQVIGFAWDKENDGTVDHHSATRLGQFGSYSDIRTFVYPREGAFVVRVTALDSSGATATATMLAQVPLFRHNGRPVFLAQAIPVAGNAPLTVQFTGQSFDPDGDPLQFSFDFDDNSSDRFTSSTTLTTSHIFEEPGFYSVRVRADGAGGTEDTNLDVRVYPADEIAATLRPFGLFGRAPLTVPFSAAGSAGGPTPIARYEWFLDRGIFADNMESGPSRWTAQSPWALTQEIATSGNSSWSDSPNGRYADNADVSLVSKPFALPPAPDTAVLTFFQRYETEANADLCRVEVSTDGGNTFVPLELPFSPGVPAIWSGLGSDFQTLSLAEHAGKPDVRVRFRLTTNESRTQDGWHIDDVRVHIERPRATGTPDFVNPTSSELTFTYDVPGLYRPHVRIVNSQGGSASESIVIDVRERQFREVQLTTRELPDRPPYRVLFQIQAGFTGSVDGPLEMSMDFDADGIYDWSESAEQISRLVYFLYQTPGPKRAKVRVTDHAGNTGFATTEFTLRPRAPQVTLLTEPIEGRVPLSVQFFPSINSTEPITSFVWHFGEDGRTFAGTGTPVTTSFTYLSGYDKCVTLVARDRAGNEVESNRVCFRLAFPDVPKVTLIPSVTRGRQPLDVSFTTAVERAAGANDPIVRYEYDFEGDDRVDAISATPEPQKFRYTRSGAIYPRVRVVDAAGRSSTHRAKIVLGVAPVSLPSAFPLSGTAPLLVEFNAFGTDEDGSILAHDFDFLGNGHFTDVLVGANAGGFIAEAGVRAPRPIRFTYTQAGVYDAVQRVTDNDGFTHDATIRIVVGSPGARLRALPSLGPPPLQVRLAASPEAVGAAYRLAGTPDARLARRYEFDLDGNGSFDVTTTSNVIPATYRSAGVVRPAVRITGADGAVETAHAEVRVAAAETRAVLITSDRTRDFAPLEVELVATTVGVTLTPVRYEWDFEGDGTFDFSSPRGERVSHVYARPGTHRVICRVTDLQGRVFYGFGEVEAIFGLEASLTTPAFDPTVGQSAILRTSLAQPARLSIRLLDRSRRHVRHLVRDAARGRGVSTDIWDGKDDSGRVVPPGVYLYLIDYVSGEIRGTVDRTSYSDPEARPQAADPEYENVFDPTQGELLRSRYRLDRSYEVTMGVVTVRGILERMLLLREPQPAGSYIVVWDGMLDDGTSAEDRSNEFFYTPYYINPLPDNAIIVQGKPVIGDVSSDPVEFTPVNPYDPAGKPAAAVRFLLSKSATVTAEVLGPGAQVLRTISRPGLAAGRHAIEWDGRDLNGLLAAPGVYRVRLRAVDPAGNRSLDQAAAIRIFY